MFLSPKALLALLPATPSAYSCYLHTPALQLADGDVTAAVEELRALGVPTGPVGLGGGAAAAAYEQAAAIYGLEELGMATEEEVGGGNCARMAA